MVREEGNYVFAEMVLYESRRNDIGTPRCDGIPGPRRGRQRWPERRAVEDLGSLVRQRHLGATTAGRDVRANQSRVGRTAQVATRSLTEPQHGNSVLQRCASDAALARRRPRA